MIAIVVRNSLSFMTFLVVVFVKGVREKHYNVFIFKSNFSFVYISDIF